jgi:hypothetical protein
VQQLASSIGLAVLASLAATPTGALIGGGHSTRDALAASGYGRGFLGAAICVLVALALAAILLPRPPADQTSRESPGRVMRSSPYRRVPVSECRARGCQRLDVLARDIAERQSRTGVQWGPNPGRPFSDRRSSPASRRVLLG